jgi:hypothetical protein
MQTEQTTIGTLFSCLAPEEQDEARHALRRYLSFIMRLHAGIAADPGERERLAALTAQDRPSSMDPGRSFTRQIQDTDV